MCTYARKCVRGTRANESLCVHGKSTETRLCERGTPAHAQNSVLGTIRVTAIWNIIFGVFMVLFGQENERWKIAFKEKIKCPSISCWFVWQANMFALDYHTCWGWLTIQNVCLIYCTCKANAHPIACLHTLYMYSTCPIIQYALICKEGKATCTVAPVDKWYKYNNRQKYVMICHKLMHIKNGLKAAL